MVAINCASMPESLVESELFGHEKGAFSGAAATKVGLLEAATGGTVFLDEVGELPAPTQAKLLRALETGKILRVGSVVERAVDVRIVAATNRDLEADASAGRFRRDLYFRIAAATVCLPPLRARPRELPILARTFLAAAAARAGTPAPSLSAAALDRLASHGWPGNVRELRNLADFLVATATGPVVALEDLPPYLLRVAAAEPAPAKLVRPLADELRDLERARIADALAATDGHQRRAAELIGMPLRTFCSRLKQYGITARR
jgi:DNA-binding NtrC family response regulator